MRGRKQEMLLKSVFLCITLIIMPQVSNGGQRQESQGIFQIETNEISDLFNLKSRKYC